MVYRDTLNSGPGLLSKSQAWPGRKFTQPWDHFLANLCTQWQSNLSPVEQWSGKNSEVFQGSTLATLCTTSKTMNQYADQVLPKLDIIKHILQYPGSINEFKPVLWPRAIAEMLLIMSSVGTTSTHLNKFPVNHPVLEPTMHMR